MLEALRLNPITVSIIIPMILFSIVMFLRTTYKFVKARKHINDLEKELEKDHIISNRNGSALIYKNKKVIDVDPYDLIEQKDYLNVSPLFVPGILTGLGIFGTFLGVSLALNAFPDHISNSTAMFKSVSQLIPAMKTAFYTSLVGLLGATLFVGIEKIFVSNIRALCLKKLKSVQNQFVTETPELYLRRQSSSQEASTKMAEAAEAIKVTMESMQAATAPEKMAALIRDGLDASVRDHLKGPLENIGNRLSVLEDVKVASQSLKTNNEILSKFIMNDLQGIFGGLKESLDSAQNAMRETNMALRPRVLLWRGDHLYTVREHGES